MVRKKFIRSKWRTYSKLGKKRKKKQVYRKPKGRDNKMKENRKGNPTKVKIGYKKQKAKKQEIKTIKSIKELSGLKEIKNEKIILTKLGKKKKIEIVKKAKQMGIKFENININKFLKKIETERQKKEEEKQEKKAKEKKQQRKEKKEEAKKTAEREKQKEEKTKEKQDNKPKNKSQEKEQENKK